MKNLLGGLIAMIIGACLIVALVGLLPPEVAYPYPFDLVWPIFVGSQALRSTLAALLDSQLTLFYLITWIVTGFIIAPFSKKGWNTVRTMIWAGVTLVILALIGQVLENPSYWDLALNPSRNYDLLYQFIVSMATSLLALLGAVPLTVVIDRIQQTAEMSVPEKIETRCSCGAVFKSNPLICSECGAILREIKD